MSSFVERVNQADLWLLDTVFQPVADRLPERMPAAELGMSLQLGSILFYVAAIVILSVAGYASLGNSVFNILNLLLLIAFYMGIMRMRQLVRPGQANPLRSLLFGMRPVNVVFLGVSLWGGDCRSRAVDAHRPLSHHIEPDLCHRAVLRLLPAEAACAAQKQKSGPSDADHGRGTGLSRGGQSPARSV
ncbi:hypothetical protein [Asaia sp. VD9]|uniref:hypothetical protein n=1 Tax=Asaia sp. VD9 TaxID=3081235 RepID=UPI00301ACAA2